MSDCQGGARHGYRTTQLSKGGSKQPGSKLSGYGLVDSGGRRPNRDSGYL